MPFDPIAARRIQALLRGRALPTHTHARIALQPHALAVSAVPLSGDDSSLHAVAFGWLSRTAEVLTIPHPRDVPRQEALFASLGERFERVAEFCLRRQTFPQIVLTSRGALELLRNIADDHRFFDRNPGAARFARQMTYFTERAEVETQQAVVVMTDLLTWHWATPLPVERELDLGVVLATIDPGPEGLEAAIERAALMPMGAGTDSRFDNEQLLPALLRRRRHQRAIEAAERRGDGAAAEDRRTHLKRVGKEIHDLLSGVVLSMDRGIRRSVDLFRSLAAPELPEVTEWVQTETEEFVSFQQALGAGHLTPRRDRPKSAAFRLLERETALAHLETAVELGDDFGRVRGLQAGHAIRGRVENVARHRLPGTRRTNHTFDLITDQEGLTIRVWDELRCAANTELLCTVLGYSAEGELTRIRFRITKGMLRPGPPEQGAEITLVRRAVELNSLRRTRSAVAGRLRIGGMPWTHVPGAVGHRRMRAAPPPSDPLQDVLALAGRE